VLVRLLADGPPEFPHVYGCFRAGNDLSGALPDHRVELHTVAPRELCRRFGVRQHWGL
jgi:hypothetical protein